MLNDTARQTSIDLNDAIWQIRPSIITWHLRRVILSGLGDNMTRICSWTTSASQPFFPQLLRSWVSNQSLHPNCQEQATVPNLFGTRDQFHQNSFPTEWGWLGDDSSALHLLCTLFLLLLYQFHLWSWGIRSQRLGTLDLEGLLGARICFYNQLGSWCHSLRTLC